MKFATFKDIAREQGKALSTIYNLRREEGFPTALLLRDGLLQFPARDVRLWFKQRVDGRTAANKRSGKRRRAENTKYKRALASQRKRVSRRR